MRAARAQAAKRGPRQPRPVARLVPRALVACAFLTAMASQELLAVQGASPDAESEALFGTEDLVLAAGLLAASGVFLALDADVRRSVYGMHSRATYRVARSVEPVGRSALWFQASAGTFVAGKILGQRRMADVGLHLFLSIALANTVTTGLKRLAGRSRPSVLYTKSIYDAMPYRDPYSWKLFGGWGDAGLRSYPSNHAAVAFAVATTLSQELGGVVPWFAYPIATAVAWSRVYDDAHWASDVTLGALVGIFSSRLVVRYGHRRGGPLERWLLIESDPAKRVTRLGLQFPIALFE